MRCILLIKHRDLAPVRVDLRDDDVIAIRVGNQIQPGDRNQRHEHYENGTTVMMIGLRDFARCFIARSSLSFLRES